MLGNLNYSIIGLISLKLEEGKMNEVRIPNNKEISIVKSKINQRFNNQRDQISCALCGKELKNQSRSFHKSHTVPFFCLEI